MPNRSSAKSKSVAPAAAQASPAQSPAAPSQGLFGRDLANWLFPGFLAGTLLGFFLIWKIGSPPGNPNPVRALFIAMNAATLSGFPANVGGQLNPAGEVVALCLIIFGSLFTMIVGGLAVIRIARLPFSDVQLILSAIGAEILALVVGTFVLWDSDRSLMQSAFLAVSSFGNCGIYLADGATPEKVLPGALIPLVHIVILPLTVLGGLGICTLMEIVRSLIFRTGISAHARATIGMSAWLYAIGLILILLLNQAGRGWFDWSTLRAQLSVSSVVAIETRTGGLAIVSISDLTAGARWIVVVLMAMGAGSAGAASGLKVTTVVELIRGGKRLLEGRNPGRPFGIACVWIATYGGIVLGAVLLLSYVGENDPGNNVLFNAVSAASNVGFTAAPIPDQRSLFFAYSAIILVGRMAPLMVLWWMADTTSGADLAVG